MHCPNGTKCCREPLRTRETNICVGILELQVRTRVKCVLFPFQHSAVDSLQLVSKLAGLTNLNYLFDCLVGMTSDPHLEFPSLPRKHYSSPQSAREPLTVTGVQRQGSEAVIDTKLLVLIPSFHPFHVGI